jgi:hypothetical protein
MVVALEVRSKWDVQRYEPEINMGPASKFRSLNIQLSPDTSSGMDVYEENANIKPDPDSDPEVDRIVQRTELDGGVEAYI